MTALATEHKIGWLKQHPKPNRSHTMPTFLSDGVEIYYQVAGEGYPLDMAHQIAGDITSWEL